MNESNYHGSQPGAVEWRLQALEEAHKSMKTERIYESSQLTQTLLRLQTSLASVAMDIAVIKSERKNFNFGMMIWMPVATTALLWFFDHLFSIMTGTSMIGHAA